MPRVGTVTLYFDPPSYRSETGERLTKDKLEQVGQLINDEIAASWLGYSGWSTKFVFVPARDPA